MSTEKQRLAQKRNWNKHQIAGGQCAGISEEALTGTERKLINQIRLANYSLLEHWSLNNVRLGLKK